MSRDKNNVRDSRTWEFEDGDVIRGIAVELKDTGARISVYSRGPSPSEEAGAEFTGNLQDLAGAWNVPDGILAGIEAFIQGRSAPDVAVSSPDLAREKPHGPALFSVSWEEGSDLEFEYRIDAFENGILFSAGGDAERGIEQKSEFCATEAGAEIRVPDFMSRGGSFFLYEQWLKERLPGQKSH